MAEQGNAAAMRLCDELIRAAYDADICSPYDLAQRVRKIKDAIGSSSQGNAAAMREACRMLNDEGDDTLCEKLKCPWHGEPNGCNSPSGEYQTTAKLSGFGNAVAMHSCLVKILAEMLDFCGMEVGRKACFSPDAVAEEIRAALAVPPRNCDVGTPEEQARRFQLFCQAHRAFDADCSSNCPFVDTADINHCQSGWAQLPYKEGGAE